jgi:hypothetical protein
MLMSHSRDLDSRRFHYALGNRELFFKDRDDSLPVGMRGRGIKRTLVINGVIKGRIHDEEPRGKGQIVVVRSVT